MSIRYSTMKSFWQKGMGCFLVVFGLVGIPSVGLADDDVVYEKHTVVDFGDDTIEGDLTRPDGQYLESRKRLRHERLIRVRQSFRQEVLQSVRLL